MSFVISNKHRIHYRLSGERGPWLILHPPFILDHECWDMSGFVQLLERDFRLMLIDPLGHGRSVMLLKIQPVTAWNPGSRMC